MLTPPLGTIFNFMAHTAKTNDLVSFICVSNSARTENYYEGINMVPFLRDSCVV